MGASTVQGWLNRHEITVGVFHEEECWDLILDLDAYPERRGNGFVCRQCEREGKRETFASREAVWRDHLFEPFLQWVNETLAPAKVLTLYGSESGGATWARLEQERPTGADLARALCVVPLVPQGDNAAALSP